MTQPIDLRQLEAALAADRPRVQPTVLTIEYSQRLQTLRRVEPGVVRELLAGLVPEALALRRQQKITPRYVAATTAAQTANSHCLALLR